MIAEVFKSCFACPRCGGKLSYDNSIERYRCTECQRIFSFELEGNKAIWREWIVFEAPPIIEGHKYVKNHFGLFDLTKMYGEGKEPSEDEFNKMFMIFPYFTYERGEKKA